MDKPIRVQRKRSKGWKMPANTVYVGRPSKWGNPYSPDDFIKNGLDGEMAEKGVIAAFSSFVHHPLNHEFRAEIIKELKGKSLACWCPLDKACHADKLLEIANA